MAVFLTVALAELIRALAGFVLARAVGRLELAPGLYPVFVGATALLTFGATPLV